MNWYHNDEGMCEVVEHEEMERLREIEKVAKGVVQLAIVRDQLPESFLAMLNQLAIVVDTSRDFEKEPLS